MPIKILEGSFNYCMENKLFFVFVVIVLFGCQYLIEMYDAIVIGPIISAVLTMGYGLQVTRDIIKGGTRLPKILPKKVISFGIKGYLVFIFYTVLQLFLLVIISVNLDFPTLEIEELILNFNETVHLFFTHHPVSFFIVVVSTFVIVYVTSFFMELALARLADGGNLINAFNFPRIKHAIDVIGWKRYTAGYTKIMLSIVFLTFLIRYNIQVGIVDAAVDTFLNFLIFVIQYIGIGNVYKVYTQNKIKIDGTEESIP